jgi:uncharacterized alkaline shock family protein YloU
VTVLAHGAIGAVSIAPRALSQLVVQAAESVDGVRVRRTRRHLVVAIADGRARVALELAIRFGVVLPEAARSVQDRVADALRAMCGVVVDAVDVSVEEIA